MGAASPLAASALRRGGVPSCPLVPPPGPRLSRLWPARGMPSRCGPGPAPFVPSFLTLIQNYKFALCAFLLAFLMLSKNRIAPSFVWGTRKDRRPEKRLSVRGCICRRPCPASARRVGCRAESGHARRQKHPPYSVSRSSFAPGIRAGASALIPLRSRPALCRLFSVIWLCAIVGQGLRKISYMTV